MGRGINNHQKDNGINAQCDNNLYIRYLVPLATRVLVCSIRICSRKGSFSHESFMLQRSTTHIIKMVCQFHHSKDQ